LGFAQGTLSSRWRKRGPFEMTPEKRNIEHVDYFFFIRRYWITDKTAPIKAKPIRTASAGL
jgi:hypothetical protein